MWHSFFTLFYAIEHSDRVQNASLYGIHNCSELEATDQADIRVLKHTRSTAQRPTVQKEVMVELAVPAQLEAQLAKCKTVRKTDYYKPRTKTDAVSSYRFLSI